MNAFQLDATTAGFDVDAYRDPRRSPFRAGDRVATNGLTVAVEKVRNGRPTLIEVQFDQPLEDPSLYFVTRTSRGFQPITMPPIGGELHLALASEPVGADGSQAIGHVVDNSHEVSEKRSVDRGIDRN